MKKTTIAVVISLLTVALLVVPALAKGGSSKGSNIWWIEDGDQETLAKAIFKETGSGIIHQWRYFPEHLHLVFKPASEFPNEPDEGDYFYWPFDASRYTEKDPYSGSLSDFFTDGAYYWVKIAVQD